MRNSFPYGDGFKIIELPNKNVTSADPYGFCASRRLDPATLPLVNSLTLFKRPTLLSLTAPMQCGALQHTKKPAKQTRRVLHSPSKGGKGRDRSGRGKRESREEKRREREGREMPPFVSVLSFSLPSLSRRCSSLASQRDAGPGHAAKRTAAAVLYSHHI